MKEIKNNNKKSIIKKIFIKISRFFGYEIIDQNNFEIPTLNKTLNEDINIIGSKSINLPLGEVKSPSFLELLIPLLPIAHFTL